MAVVAVVVVVGLLLLLIKMLLLMWLMVVDGPIPYPPTLSLRRPFGRGTGRLSAPLALDAWGRFRGEFEPGSLGDEFRASGIVSSCHEASDVGSVL